MKTLLIIDDETDLIEALTTFLSFEGYRVLPPMDGHKALEALRRGQPLPDLILLDLMMPEVSGFDVLRMLRKNTTLRKIPVLVMSATYGPAESGALRGLPFIRKPFDLDELLLGLSKLLRTASKLRQAPPEA